MKKQEIARKMKSIKSEKKSEEKKGWYGAKNFDEHYVPKVYRK